MARDFEFIDHSPEVRAALERATQNALTAIGVTAETHAKETPGFPVVTGRLRNSITYATERESGRVHTYKDDNKNTYSEEIPKMSQKDRVIIGTNVEYAAGIETGSHRMGGGVHFLDRAATNHSTEYKDLARRAFSNINN